MQKVTVFLIYILSMIGLSIYSVKSFGMGIPPKSVGFEKKISKINTKISCGDVTKSYALSSGLAGSVSLSLNTNYDADYNGAISTMFVDNLGNLLTGAGRIDQLNPGTMDVKFKIYKKDVCDSIGVNWDANLGQCIVGPGSIDLKSVGLASNLSTVYISYGSPDLTSVALASAYSVPKEKNIILNYRQLYLGAKISAVSVYFKKLDGTVTGLQTFYGSCSSFNITAK